MIWGLDAGQLSLLFWICWSLYNLYSWVAKTYYEITNNLKQLSEALKCQNQNIHPVHIENNTSKSGLALLAELIPSYAQMFFNMYSKNPASFQNLLSKTTDENKYNNISSLPKHQDIYAYDMEDKLDTVLPNLPNFDLNEFSSNKNKLYDFDYTNKKLYKETHPGKKK